MMKLEDMQYQRPNYEEEKRKMEELCRALKQAPDKETFLDLFQKINDIRSNINTMEQLNYVYYSINTNDSFAKEEKEYWDTYSPLYQALDRQFFDCVLSSPWKDIPEIPHTFLQLIENKQKTFSDAVIAESREESKWVDRYETLKSNARISFQGQTLTLSQLGKYREHPDRTIRQEANERYFAFFEEQENTFDEIYDALVKIRTTMAYKLGFANYVEMAYCLMNRMGYTKEDVAYFRDRIKQDVIPYALNLQEEKKQRLGLDILYYYDTILYPEGNPTPLGTEEEKIEKAITMYQELSPITSTFFKKMVDHHWMDLESKQGKMMGGYCTYLEDFHAPFIFANFNGTSHDVEVLTHEFGHALQSHLANEEKDTIKLPELIYPTMESAEIFSTAMELLTFPWMDRFYGKDTNRYKKMQLDDKISFLLYGALVDHFQEEVYLHPEWNKEQRKEIWRKLELEYMPWKDYRGNSFLQKGTYWYVQSHIFSSPFYYIDYALAHVAALELWMESEKNYDEAFQKYLHLASLGGRGTFLELLQEGDLHNPFHSNELKEIIRFVNDYKAHLS